MGKENSLPIVSEYFITIEYIIFLIKGQDYSLFFSFSFFLFYLPFLIFQLCPLSPSLPCTSTKSQHRWHHRNHHSDNINRNQLQWQQPWQHRNKSSFQANDHNTCNHHADNDNDNDKIVTTTTPFQAYSGDTTTSTLHFSDLKIANHPFFSNLKKNLQSQNLQPRHSSASNHHNRHWPIFHCTTVVLPCLEPPTLICKSCWFQRDAKGEWLWLLNSDNTNQSQI